MATLGEYLGAGSSTTKLLLHLNGNSTDSSGNANNSTDTSITYSLANGRFGQGAGFNGSSSKILSTLSLPANGTMACLIKTSAAGSQGIIGKNKSGDVTRIDISSGIINFTIQVSSGATYSISSTSTYNDGLFHFVLATWGSGGMKLYVDASLVDSDAYTSYADTATYFSIGDNEDEGGTPTWFFNGSIDEVIIENTAWSASKVKKYYTNSKGRFATL